MDTLYRICSDPRLNHRVPMTGGVRERACGDILRAFFAQRRTRAAAPAPDDATATDDARPSRGAAPVSNEPPSATGPSGGASGAP